MVANVECVPAGEDAQGVGLSVPPFESGGGQRDADSLRFACRHIDTLEGTQSADGTVGVIVLTDEEDSSAVVEAVRTNLLTVHGYGIRYDVDTPDRTYVKIKHHIVLSDRLSDAEKQEIRYQVQTALADYFQTLKVGESIIIDKITQIVMNVSPEIIQEMNESFYINGEKAIYVNQSCRWRESFVLSTEIDNVIVT